MKWLLLHSILLFLLPFQDLENLRLAYKEAGHNDSKIEAFSTMVEHISKEDNPVLVGYKGAAMALMAKKEKTIKDKKLGFDEGTGLLEYAISKAPNDIELRFIRIGIQENAPKLLKYRGNIDEDKTFLMAQFAHIPSEKLKKHIGAYIKQSKVFSEAEKQSLNL